MRRYLTQRKAALLGAVVVVSMMTGYEAGAMKCASPPKLPSTGSYEIGSSAILAPSDDGIIASGPVVAAQSVSSAVQSKPAADNNSPVRAIRRLVCRHPHHVHKLPNQQDFDFGYVFGGSDLD